MAFVANVVPHLLRFTGNAAESTQHGEDDHSQDQAVFDGSCPLFITEQSSRKICLGHGHPANTVLTCPVCQPVLKKVLMSEFELPNIPTMIPVVAVAMIASDGRILMQQRRADRAFGGLWEFPGGKVEPGESPESALVREIEEELGLSLDPAGLEPLTFASDPAQPPAPRQPHVILLYTCRTWSGEPRCLEADSIAWIAAEELMALPMPPLDIPLAKALLKAI